MSDDAFHLTALDARRYDFGNALRGYDRARVDQFRDQVAEELERLSRANQELEVKARNFHEQLRAFRERDKALNDALISAQQLRGEIREQAQREAQLIIREAQGDAERSLEALRGEIRRAEDELQTLWRNRRSYIQQLRQSMERQLHDLDSADMVPPPVGVSNQGGELLREPVRESTRDSVRDSARENARDVLQRETQARDAQARDTQVREAQARESQAREAQARDAQMRDAQLRESQARELQSREAPKIVTREQQALSTESPASAPTQVHELPAAPFVPPAPLEPRVPTQPWAKPAQPSVPQLTHTQSVPVQSPQPVPAPVQPLMQPVPVPMPPRPITDSIAPIAPPSPQAVPPMTRPSLPTPSWLDVVDGDTE